MAAFISLRILETNFEGDRCIMAYCSGFYFLLEMAWLTIFEVVKEGLCVGRVAKLEGSCVGFEVHVVDECATELEPYDVLVEEYVEPEDLHVVMYIDLGELYCEFDEWVVVMFVVFLTVPSLHLLE